MIISKTKEKPKRNVMNTIFIFLNKSTESFIQHKSYHN